MNRHQNDRAAFALGMLTVLCWSTVATAFKLTLRHADVFQLLLYSSFTAAVCLYLILAARGQARSVWRLHRWDYLRCAGLGLLNPLCYYLVLFKAYDLLPGQVAQALNYTWVITLMLLSVPLLRQKMTRRDAGAAAVCYAGAVVVCVGGGTLPPEAISGAGVALALGSTVLWSLYWIGKTRDPLDPVISLFLSFLFSLPLVAVVCWAFSDPARMDMPGLLGAVYVGLFEMGITYVFWLLALQYAESASKVSTLIFLSPFLSLVFLHFVAAEPIAPTTFLGLLLIAAGLLGQRFPASAAPLAAVKTQGPGMGTP